MLGRRRILAGRERTAGRIAIEPAAIQFHQKRIVHLHFGVGDLARVVPTAGSHLFELLIVRRFGSFKSVLPSRALLGLRLCFGGPGVWLGRRWRLRRLPLAESLVSIGFALG
jgi:hypothetical protein